MSELRTGCGWRWGTPDGDLTDDLPGDVVVVALDAWTVPRLRQLGSRATAAGVRLLPLRHDGAVAVLGPLLGPGAGCVGCAEDSRLHAYELPTFTEPPRFDGAFTPMVRVVVDAVLADIVRDPAAATDRMWLIDSSDATLSEHRVLPRPGCLACSAPVDGPAFAPFVPAPRPLPEPGVLRQLNELATLERLRRQLVEPRCGPVVTVRTAPEPLPTALVSAAFMLHGRPEWSHGRAVRVEDAERVALLEAVERRLAMQPHARQGAVSAAFDELGPERAIDPASLGLSDPKYDHHPASRVLPYAPDVGTRWVPGWSMTRRTSTLVPENVAFFGLVSAPGAPRFVDETSNGCSLGNSLEEAALHGLFELIERDAFLMAWYARTQLTRITAPDDDELVAGIVDWLDEAGYDLLLFDATSDIGLPVVISLTLCRTDDPGRPHAYFAAGAHLDPREAVRSAAQQGAVGVETHAVAVRRRQGGDLARERLLGMLADPTDVRALDDHVALYSLPEARPRYDYLLDGPGPVPWQDLWPDPPPRPEDLTPVLLDMVDRLAGLGLETVVVDLTDRWTREQLGLHAAKVIVPGTVPMAFGFVNQRTVGLPRLLRVPFELGRAPAVRTHDDLTLLPHPFG